jgi:NAD(P)H-dependent flavin oxidoreductase YrpB (nitropropane dioxygenase family)
MRTRVTELLGIDHPVLSAGIPVIGIDLVAAVSNAGGLGILGATYLSPTEILDIVATLRSRTTRPFALNLLVPFCMAAQLEACLEARVPVLSTAWGPPDDAAARARAAGIPLVHMVTTAEQGAAAARAGVSIIAAQGHEAGGGLVGPVGGLVLIPAVVDAVAAAMPGFPPPPVVAAGGVADGRGLAAALTLGAEGVLVGTRFLATEEASVPPVWKAAICAARETDTVHTRVGNLVMRPTWSDVAPGRVLRTRAIEAWLGREPELAALPASERDALAARWREARAAGRREDTEIIAGQDCGLIRDVLPAAEVVRWIVTEAEAILGRVGAVRRMPVPEPLRGTDVS